MLHDCFLSGGWGTPAHEICKTERECEETEDEKETYEDNSCDLSIPERLSVGVNICRAAWYGLVGARGEKQQMKIQKHKLNT